MKKLTSLFLALVMFVSSFAGCSYESTPSVSQNITVATSDAESAAELLSDRLGIVTENVVLGVGDSDKYGIDMSDFEDDGYIIKTEDSSVVIFGKTEDALSSAVRKYANSVEDGVILGNITYHEGYRIEKFTLLDRDISEYRIIHSTTANRNMTFAAMELQRLLEIACGVTLPIEISDEDVPGAIILRHTDDEALDIAGYRYYAENGSLMIEGAVREGVLNGVYMFLENECGWDYLYNGPSELQETDHLVIGEDISAEAVPAFEFFLTSYRKTEVLPLGNDKTFIEQLSKDFFSIYSYPVRHANHGMDKNNWANFDPHYVQICYTNEGNLDTVVSRIVEHLDAKEAAGDIIGETVRFIDIAQGDNGRYCLCNSCMEVLGIEKSHTGAVVRFANEVATQVNELFPGADIMFLVFAYFKAFAPPAVTVPNEWVSVSYAPNGSCANHKMDGTECDPNVITDFDTTGVQFGQYLDQWCEISDNMYVWYYQITMNFNYHTIWDVLYDDLRHMHEIGVKGIYFFGYQRGWGLKRIEHALAHILRWNIDMTREEYEAEYLRLLEREYGEGWEYVKEHLDLCKEAENDKCWSCWMYADVTAGIDFYDLGYVASNFDTSFELLSKAIELAESPMEVQLCERMMIEEIYRGCYASFYAAYNNYDEERLQVLSDRYDYMLELLAKYGIDHTAIPNLIKISVSDNIEDEAFIEWNHVRDRLPSGNAADRPLPDAYLPDETTTEVTEEIETL